MSGRGAEVIGGGASGDQWGLGRLLEAFFFSSWFLSFVVLLRQESHYDPFCQREYFKVVLWFELSFCTLNYHFSGEHMEPSMCSIVSDIVLK